MIIPTSIQYDKMIWCGLSWAAAEVKSSSFDPRKPLEIQCSSSEPENLVLKAEVYETIS